MEPSKDSVLGKSSDIPIDWRLDLETIDNLIKTNFLNKSQFDLHLSRALREAKDMNMLLLAADVIHTHCGPKQRSEYGLSMNDLTFTVHFLRGLEHTPDLPESVVEMLKKLPPVPKKTTPSPEPLQDSAIQEAEPPAQGAESVVQPIERPVQPVEPAVQPTNRALQPVEPVVQLTERAVQPAEPAVQPTKCAVQLAEPAVRSPWADAPVAAGTRNLIKEQCRGDFYTNWIPVYRAYSGQDLDNMKTDFYVFLSGLSKGRLLRREKVFMLFLEGCFANCVAIANKHDEGIFEFEELQEASAALVRFVTLFIYFAGEAQRHIGRVVMLDKFLNMIGENLTFDYNSLNKGFSTGPYKQLLRDLLKDMTMPVFDNCNNSIAHTFTTAFRPIGPTQISSFSYIWLELISHPDLTDRVLRGDDKCWLGYADLLTDLLQFLAPHLLRGVPTQPLLTLYKGTLRLLMMLLHAHPNFLASFADRLLNVIPPSAHQLRNVVLAGHPTEARIPEPFDRTVFGELISICKAHEPAMRFDSGRAMGETLRVQVDHYLNNRNPALFVFELPTKLQLKEQNELGYRFDAQKINALVLYIGVKAVEVIHLANRHIIPELVINTPNFDILFNLVQELSKMGSQGRYLAVYALINQIRYPSSHTHYFIIVILNIFHNTEDVRVKEQIARSFFEHLIVYRPWAWGMVVAFIELTQNPIYQFWKQPFNTTYPNTLLRKVLTMTPRGFNPNPVRQPSFDWIQRPT